MITKPKDWETVEAQDGSFKRLPAGGHVCRIMQATSAKSKNGNEMIVICFDIEGGEYNGYYSKMFEQSMVKDGANAKYPSGGIFRQCTDGKSTGIFKGVIQNIEKSNQGYVWNWDERTLTGKLFGGVFREEEYISQRDGQVKKSVKCIAVRPVEGIENVPVPTPKKAEETSSPMQDEIIPF